MTQPTLLEVPPNRTRLEIWKDRHGVTVIPPYAELHKWHIFRPGDFLSYFPSGDLTEEEACFTVAQAIGLPWLQGITPEVRS